ncbi:MAG: PEGA domain-containing protein [Deltaproteobacteria bacterium]|nr:PEGA domain-containing protein [Deltaproteobacteria bacterium]
MQPKRFPARACLLALALTLAGCAGQNTLYITSEPPGAQLYVNQKLVGTTPQEVPQAWHWFPPFFVWGDDLNLELRLAGYAPQSAEITYWTTHWRWMEGDYAEESKFGRGHTYRFPYRLTPEK